MIAAVSTIEAAPEHRAPGHHVVVLAAAGLATTAPVWLREWCRRCGRELTVREVGSTGGLGSSALLREAENLLGAIVFVNRPATDRRQPTRVTAALRERAGDEPVLIEAVDVAQQLRAELEIAHAVPLSYGERSVGLPAAIDQATDILKGAAQRVEREAPSVHVLTRLYRRYPHELAALDTDLLVLGWAHRDNPTRVGLVARSALSGGDCPLLLVPPGVTRWPRTEDAAVGSPCR
jgi:nucleotide-binding universal stress UspA family protein